VYLSNNALTGTIPSNVGDAPLLRDLYLMHNQLTGSIPSIADDSWRNLTELLLQDNELTGIMPDLICRLRSEAILEDLWVDCAGNEPEVECSCCTQCVFA
jgi:Leucine-rich repeat (LRR) protein